MLSPTAKTNICTILGALVNAGGVRPEDHDDVQTALSDLQTEVTADEATLADHEKRISALDKFGQRRRGGGEPAPEVEPAPAVEQEPAPGTAVVEAEPTETSTQAAAAL